MKIVVYTANGQEGGSEDLNPILFAAPINEDLMHRAVVMRLANNRNAIAHTKTRGEIACSTRKIFRQKGTGNARRGAKSTNLLRGGGVTHGPTNRANYSKMMPKKERRAALFSALSVKAGASDIFALEKYEVKVPKTKDFIALLKNLPEGKKYLFVLDSKNEMFEKSCRNVPNVTTILAPYLNPRDLLWADKVCFTDGALAKTESTFITA